MKTKENVGAEEARKDYPSHLIFEEVDGIFWLKGNDLERASKLLDLGDCDRPVGFEGATLSGYLEVLADKGVKVAFLRGSTIIMAEPHRVRQVPRQVKGTPIGLAPELLLGRQELDRLHETVRRGHSYLSGLVDRVLTQYAAKPEKFISELGKLYVYQVAEDMYEVDWELTRLTKVTFEAAAIVADAHGSKLRCWLVAPKGRRKGGAAPRPTENKLTVSQPVTYGQLRLTL